LNTFGANLTQLIIFELNIRRIILTHVHPDHIQATNELRKKVAEDVKVYAHWVEAAYLSQNPSYVGPPSHEQIKGLFEKFGVKMEDLAKRFGPTPGNGPFPTAG